MDIILPIAKYLSCNLLLYHNKKAYLRAKTMDREKLMIIYYALDEAKYLISEEIQCLMSEDVLEEYQNTLDKIECALRVVREYGANRYNNSLGDT
jgi:hypothetical protein